MVERADERDSSFPRSARERTLRPLRGLVAGTQSVHPVCSHAGAWEQEMVGRRSLVPPYTGPGTFRNDNRSMRAPSRASLRSSRS